MTYKPELRNRISEDGVNSRAPAALLAGATFQGTVEDVSEYGRAGISIHSTNTSDGVLTIEVSRDGVIWGGPSRTVANAQFAEPHMWNIVEKYFRVKYVNGTTEADDLTIQVQYSVNADTVLGHQLDGVLIAETEAQVVRAVGVGQVPDGTFANIGVSGEDGNNSSTTNLTAGTSLVFTGAWSPLTHYAGITCLIDGTAAGTVSGTLQMQFSHDGVTVHRNIAVATADITNTLPRTLGTVAPYFRVIFTADADLTSFECMTMLHNTQVGLVSRMSATIQGTEDVILVRDPTHFDLDAARVHIAGQRSFFFFGFNNDVDAVWEDIWAAGGDINWQTTPAKVKVASSHAADTAAGLGLQSVEIHGLSATGEDQEEVLALSGTTPVESVLTYIRVNKIHSEEVGTYGGSHQGDIECRVTNATFANGDLLSTMKGQEGASGSSVQYGRGEAGNGFWSVPLGKVMYITRLGVAMSVGTNKTISIALYERDNLLDVTTPFQPRRVLWEVAEISEPHTKTFKSHVKIKSLADIWFRAIGSGADNKIEVSLDFYLVDADSEGA